jgi:hypothetical protein
MTKLLIVLALLPSIATAQSPGPHRGPIIDVHLHAHTRESLAQPVPNPATGEMSPKTAEEHMTRSLAIMKERNVVLGIVSGSALADVEAWDTAAPDRIIKGLSIDDPIHRAAGPGSAVSGKEIGCVRRSGSTVRRLLSFGPGV